MNRSHHQIGGFNPVEGVGFKDQTCTSKLFTSESELCMLETYNAGVCQRKEQNPKMNKDPLRLTERSKGKTQSGCHSN